jgi:hypothetical protein
VLFQSIIYINITSEANSFATTSPASSYENVSFPTIKLGQYSFSAAFWLLTNTIKPNSTGFPGNSEVVFKICFNEYFSSTPFGLPKGATSKLRFHL